MDHHLFGLSSSPRILRSCDLGRSNVHLHVLFEVLNLQAFTVKKDLHRPGHIINALSQKACCILVDPIHPKPFEIRFECNAGILFALRVLRDLRLSANPHVIGPSLLVLLLGILVRSIDGKFK